ncbi:MFS family permease [Paraburkholderia sp. Clong3]|uniref:MFS transporter n=1 Tax=Paraburkholderia sp. Clong3 TaxID=2991061 RepID=UPI003D2268A7
MSSVDSLHRPFADTIEPRRWTMLTILLCGIFLAPLDFFIVNFALPAIQGELHATAAQLQLIISTFAASYAVFLIIGGRLSDLYGRTRVFTIGLLGFVASSIVCGRAPTITVLIVGRALQGLSAAAMVPQGLATVNVIFPAQEKPRAFSIYAATYGFASAAAQIIGGLVISLDIFHRRTQARRERRDPARASARVTDRVADRRARGRLAVVVVRAAGGRVPVAAAYILAA